MNDEEGTELDVPEDEETLRLLTSIDGRLETLTALMAQVAQALAAIAAADGIGVGGAVPDLPPMNLDALDGLGDDEDQVQ